MRPRPAGHHDGGQDRADLLDHGDVDDPTQPPLGEGLELVEGLHGEDHAMKPPVMATTGMDATPTV